MSIVEEIRQDREKGAKRLESEYKAGLMALARRFCADESDAEDLVNRTFAIVVANIDSYLEQSAFFGWMSRILVNCHSKDVRRKSNEMELSTAALPEDAEDVDACAKVFREVDASLLRDAIEHLTPDIKHTLLMHYFMDMPIREVARVLSVPSGTVMWRLHYARQILGAKLGVAIKKPAVALVAIGLVLLVSVAAVVADGLRDAESANQGGNHGDEMVGRAVLSAPQTTDAALTGDETVGHVVPSATQTGTQLENNPKGESLMSKVRAAAAALTAAITTAPLAAANGDEYQFIDPTTYPAENVSYSARSSAIAVDAGALRVAGVSDNLEARSRTKGASAAILLDATKWHGMIISVF